MATKHIRNDIEVDLTNAREVWDNGEQGDARVIVVDNGEYVWAETNGGPVADREDLYELLVGEGMSPESAQRAIDGDTDNLD